MVPLCLFGALGSALNFVFNAAILAGSIKHFAVFVDPLPPGVALITFPVVSTSIVTTTIPSSLHSGFSMGFDSAFLPAKL